MDQKNAAAFESASELQAAHAALLERLDDLLDAAGSEDAALAQMLPEVQSFVDRGAATGVYLDEVRDRTACQVLLDYWAAGLGRASGQKAASKLARFDGERLPVLAEDACPYAGLESFRHGRLFFGREADTQALLQQIEATPLVVVLGASGSGKSSLVLGGALPALRNAPDRWRVAESWVPGDAPLQRLAQALSAITPPGDGRALATALRKSAAAAPKALAGGVPAVLTIDQAEELFTLADEAERAVVVAALAALLEAGHRIVLTMREDFRSRLVQLAPFKPWLDAAWYSMRPMGYDELRAAVERPAAAANLNVHPDVVDDLVKKVLGQPAALPLLQFTLRALWRFRDRNRITKEVYARIGDPLTALETSANRFVDSQAPETQDEIKRVLLALVRVDELLEAYRQPVRLRTLQAAGRANTDEVLRLLVEGDYVRITRDDDGVGDSVVEVKHEALIRNWPRFVGWIDEKRVARRQRMALAQAASRWAESGRPADGLLTGWQLQEAKNRAAELSDREREFVAASEKAVTKAEDHLRALARRERRLRIGAWVFAGVFFVIAVPLLGWLWWRNVDAEQRVVDAEVRAQATLKEVDQVLPQVEQMKSDLAKLRRERDALNAERDRLTAAFDELFARRVKEGFATEPGAAAGPPVTLFIHIASNAQRDRANELAQQLKASGIRVPGIQKVDVQLPQTQVRYFHDGDRLGAGTLAHVLDQTLGLKGTLVARVNGSEQKVPRNQFELWFAPSALPDGYTQAPATVPVPVQTPVQTPAPRASAAPVATAPPPPPPEPKPAPPPMLATAPAEAAPASVVTAASQAPAAVPNPWSAADRARLLVYRLDNHRVASRVEDARNLHPVSWAWCKSRAEAMNLRTALAWGVLFDTSAAQGVIQASTIRSRAEPSRGDTASEKAWLLDFLARRQALADRALRPQLEAARIAELRRLIEAGQWELADERPAAR